MIFQKLLFQFRMESSYLFNEKYISCFQGKFVLAKHSGKLSCWIFPNIKGSANCPNSRKLLELPYLQTLKLEIQLLELLLQLGVLPSPAWFVQQSPELMGGLLVPVLPSARHHSSFRNQHLSGYSSLKLAEILLCSCPALSLGFLFFRKQDTEEVGKGGPDLHLIWCLQFLIPIFRCNLRIFLQGSTVSGGAHNGGLNSENFHVQFSM